MRKATKRAEAEAVDTASKPDASPPKKLKSRTKVTSEVAPMEARLTRAAKTKVLANNNYVDSAAETMKKSKTRVKSAIKKSKSTEDMLPKTSAGMKKSQSTDDVDPKGREPPAKKGKAVAAKKPAPKKAGSTTKAKPRKGAKKDEEPVESEEAEEAEEAKESEDEESKETVRPPGRKASGKAAAKVPVAGETKEKEVPKKRAAAAAAKKTTRRRGKASAAVDEEEKPEEEDDEETEEAKPAKGRNGKGIEKAKPEAKMPHGKKTAPIIDSEEKETNGDEKQIDDVAKDMEEVAKKVKPTKGKKGKASAASAKMPRGKKAAPVAEAKELDEEEDAAEADEDAKSDRKADNDTEPELPAQNGTSNDQDSSR